MVMRVPAWYGFWARRYRSHLGKQFLAARDTTHPSRSSVVEPKTSFHSSLTEQLLPLSRPRSRCSQALPSGRAPHCAAQLRRSHCLLVNNDWDFESNRPALPPPANSLVKPISQNTLSPQPPIHNNPTRNRSD